RVVGGGIAGTRRPPDLGLKPPQVVRVDWNAAVGSGSGGGFTPVSLGRDEGAYIIAGVHAGGHVAGVLPRWRREP
ncbi:MAG TPA: hypothetical protein VJP78_01650, partial [Thermoleophilia bacterium]|nr:hypothetical protein [Thermoleophilia bacterium]